jgi:hypothetical protein
MCDYFFVEKIYYDYAKNQQKLSRLLEVPEKEGVNKTVGRLSTDCNNQS